jgi:hypothetical protein
LQSIAKDKIIRIFNPLGPLSKNGEPARALWASYVVGGLMVLIGELNLVAPLLSMCFLVCYAFMNIACFALTWLNSTAFRPSGIEKKRWRLWYMGTGGFGFIIAVTIMFTIDKFWALGALSLSMSLYFYINWTLEAREWGSALDGIRFQLALRSLIQIEETQHHTVNWRPQVLILYRVHLSEELKGIKHHEILRFYSHLRKGQGFCVVACVLEADQKDEHAIHKAGIEKGIIKSIMKEEGIQGFAEVVVAPSWVEGTNYIIQLTGIGGLVPNTVILDWPDNWKKHPKKAYDFANVLKVALANEKAVIAMKGLRELPNESVFGTIDVWWMIHDGGFLILLSWLLVQHKVWRRCHLRVFTITEGVTQEGAKRAAALLTKTLRQRRLFDVDVEVILADHEMLEPYTHDWTLKVEERHKYKEQLGQMQGEPHFKDLANIDDIFKLDENEMDNELRHSDSYHSGFAKDDDETHCSVSDMRGKVQQLTRQISDQSKDNVKFGSPSTTPGGSARPNEFPLPEKITSGELKTSVLAGLTTSTTERSTEEEDRRNKAQRHQEKLGSFYGLNQIIHPRSKKSQLVIMNLPDLGSVEDEEVRKFMSYCDTLTKGLDTVMFVHSTGHEIFDISL